jgi:predicted dehydrogenase
MRKIRWGVLGVATIATDKVIPAMQRSAYGEVVAIASRSAERARAAATRFGLRRSYGDYDALLADPGIDAVYIPLPNHLHVPWSIRALEAGKHVLCEKPIALTAAAAETLVEAGRRHPNLKLTEAFMYRHHPQWETARRLVVDGNVGTLRTIDSTFTFFSDDPAEIVNRADIGGGALLDIGCYSVSLSRFLFGREPERVCAAVDYDPVFRTDRLTSGMMDFGVGTGTFTCGTQAPDCERVRIFGTAGRIEIETPFTPAPDHACNLLHQTDAGAETIALDPCDQYTIQADAFARAILDDTPVPTPIADAVANMRVIDAFFRSAADGGWIDV